MKWAEKCQYRPISLDQNRTWRGESTPCKGGKRALYRRENQQMQPLEKRTEQKTSDYGRHNQNESLVIGTFRDGGHSGMPFVAGMSHILPKKLPLDPPRARMVE